MDAFSGMDDSAVAELVGALAEDFTQRCGRGEQPDVEDYARRHPELAAVLREVLPALQALHAASAELPGAPAAPPDERAAGFIPAGINPVARSESAAGLPIATAPPALSDYRIVREAGRGGMAVVYEAQQLSLGRRVALKVLPTAAALDAKRLARFQNEARAAAQLHHTNIVPVFAVGCEGGVHYYAMQFIDGQTLAAVIADLRATKAPSAAEPAPAAPQHSALSTQHSGAAAPHPSSLIPHPSPAYYRSVARLAEQAAEALDYAHQMGVVHRDIKPANLMVDARGTLWVTDFGLAMVQCDASLTATGDLVGTLRYMSPEQARAQRVPVDHRTDVYSLGATLYELLTLRPAFDGTDRHELLRQIACDEPGRPRRLDRAVPPELETIVLKAMEKDPADRYATARELADDLRRYLQGEPVKAQRPGLFQRVIKWARRHRTLTVAALVVLLVVVTASATSTVLIGRAYYAEAEQRRRAQEDRAWAWQAADDMYTQVADKWLAKQPRLQPVQREFLEKALRFYERAAEQQGTDPEARRNVALARVRLGRLTAMLGRPADGLAYVRPAVEAFEALHQEDPGNTAYREGLALAYQTQGVTCLGAGQLPEAERAYRRAAELYQELSAETPQSPDFRCRAASNLESVSFVLREAGKLTEARQACNEALASLQALAAAFPDNAEVRHTLAGTQNNLVMLLDRAGRTAEAEAPARAAAAAYEKLAAEFPAEPSHREYWALALNNLAVAVRAARREAEGVRYLERAGAIQRRLADDYPALPDYRWGAATTDLNLGVLLRALRRYPDAEKAYRRAVADGRLLVKRFPTAHSYRYLLGSSEVNLGNLLRANLHQPQEAEACYRDGRALLQAAVRERPGEPSYRTTLGNCLTGLATLYVFDGHRPKDAEAALAEARDHWAALVHDFPGNPTHREQLGSTYYNLGVVFSNTARPGPSARAFEQAVAIREKLAAEFPAKAPYREAVAQASGEAAVQLVWAQGPPYAEAAKAVMLGKRAVALAPSNGRYWFALAQAYYRSGNLAGSMAAMRKVEELRFTDGSLQWLFRAMVHWQLGEKDLARRWYGRAERALEKHASQDPDERRLHAEAAALLGVTGKSPKKHKEAALPQK